MKIYRTLDKTQYQIDFCVNGREKGIYEDEITEMGGRVFRIPSKSENIVAFTKGLYSVVRENKYKNVLRITSNGMGFYDLFIAKLAGASNCMARSSNSSDGGSLKSKIAHTAGKMLFKSAVDIEIAPSDLAAIYTFGKKDYESGRVKILHNGINFDEYKYSDEARKSVRQEFHISDEQLLIGHIGRFTKQKNHIYLLNVFAKVHEKYKNSVLLLVGKGEAEEEVRAKIRELGLEDAVILAGVRKDIPKILSAMDIFVFPSLYEGMPNVLIEAQASGLICIVSDTITSDVLITELVERLALGDTDAWADKVLRCSGQNARERNCCSLPPEYDIGKVTDILTSYLQ